MKVPIDCDYESQIQVPISHLRSKWGLDVFYVLWLVQHHHSTVLPLDLKHTHIQCTLQTCSVQGYARRFNLSVCISKAEDALPLRANWINCYISSAILLDLQRKPLDAYLQRARERSHLFLTLSSSSLTSLFWNNQCLHCLDRSFLPAWWSIASVFRWPITRW